ncbi:YhjD/YihY/BrkB family envelope integrity protein, partial [Kibdelosporangium lantanae]
MSDGPTELSRRSWWQVVKRTVREFQRDNLTDWAAALTYYSVMSIFPGIVVLLSVLGMLGPSATHALVDSVQQMAPGPARDLVLKAIQELQGGSHLAGPFDDCAVLVADGRGESTSYLAGEYRGGVFKEFASQRLPHSLGLLYEDLTEHLGFARSSDEYKIMALASYGKPEFLGRFKQLVHTTPDGGFRTEIVDWPALAPRRAAGQEITEKHANLAASVQRVLEDVLLELARWLHEHSGLPDLAL